MNSTIITKTYSEPPFCEKNILRYSGCRESDTDISSLLLNCISEVRNKLTYSVCYRELPFSAKGPLCDFGLFSLNSVNLSQNLKNCRSAIIFSATIGIEIDRLIFKYMHLSPSKALMFQSIGAERIEALCDTFCKNFENEMNVKLKPRFSPGYGDLPLDVQKHFFTHLECSKRIGLFLNDSMLMSPSKSVTAFAGITDTD